METHFDCIIIGAGISGMTAAIYLKRYGYNVVLFEKHALGGQLNQIAIIENYPGYQSIDGVTLSMNTYEQINSLDIPCIYENVLSIEELGDYKKIITKNQSYTASAVILALGRERKLLGLSNETSLIGSGVSFCATCDGSFFKGEDVCVVGGGNSALEEAIYLSKICKTVTIINRGNTLRADKIFIDQVKTIENITILYDSVVTTLNEKEGKLNSIILNNGKTISCKGLFIYIGLKTDLSCLDNLNIEIESSSIVVDSMMKTSIDGIYACGDCIKKDLYQLVTATSDGALAASFVQKYLQSKGY